MATRMQAIQAYTPRIKSDVLSPFQHLVDYIGGRANLNRGTIRLVLDEVQNAIIHFTSLGVPIHVEQLGIFKAGINRKGKKRILFKPDKELMKKLENSQNDAEDRDIVIKNEDMIGKTVEDFIARWNEEHPDDPVED